MDDRQRIEFNNSLECNLALELPYSGRFRINVHRQRDQVGIVARHIKTEIPTVDELQLPDDFKEIVMKKRGLFLSRAPPDQVNRLRWQQCWVTAMQTPTVTW